MGEEVKDVWCGRVDGRVPWQVCSAATAGGRQETLAYNQATAIFLDGTNIYMSIATLFLAQATNTPLTLGELGIPVVAMITSKGASAATGAGFVTLAATLAIVPDMPIQSLALLLGIDKFASGDVKQQDVSADFRG